MVQLIDVAKVGDFVRYKSAKCWYIVPKEASGFPAEQHINLLACRLWRIFEVKNGFVKLISADNVHKLILYGKVGYANLVDTLNGISKAFVNPEYALYGRSFGSSEASTGKLSLDSISLSQVENHCFSDKEYLEDVRIIAEHGLGVPKSGLVWMASRAVVTGVKSTEFGARSFFDSHVYFSELYREYDEGRGFDNALSAGVRPIITLKPDIGLSSGNGTREEPYVVTF